MADGPSQLNKYTRLSESQAVVVNRRVSGENRNQDNAPAQQAPQEEYEWDKKAIGICAGISLAVVVLCVWLFFRSRGDATSRSKDESQIAIELLDFSQLQNFSNYDDKKQFIESQLNDRLTRYNGSLGIAEPSRANYWNINSSDLIKFKDLYTAFLKTYSQFVEVSKDSKGYYETIKAASLKYNSLENEIQAEKSNILDLLKREETLVKTKKDIDAEIAALKERQKNLSVELEKRKSKLKQEFPDAEEKAKEFQKIDCDDLKKKLQDHLDKHNRLQSELEEANLRLKGYENEKDLIKQRIDELNKDILEKEQQKNITQLDLKTSKQIKGLAEDIKKLEAEKTNKIREKLIGVLQILKEKFEILKGYGGQDTRDKEKLFFYHTTKVLKRHVQLLIKTKQFIQEEERLAQEGLSSQKAPHYIEKEIQDIKDQLKRLENDLQDHENKYKEEERKRHKQDEMIQKKLKDTDITQREVDQANNTLTACLEDLKILQANFSSFISKKHELVTPVESEIKEVDRNLENKSYVGDTQKDALTYAHKNISNVEKKINHVVKDLAHNYQTLKNEKDTYEKKQAKLIDTYNELEFEKQRLIEFLTHIGEPSKPENEKPEQVNEQPKQVNEQEVPAGNQL